MPRVVTAGVPTRKPPALNTLTVSNGIAFLFTVMAAWSSVFVLGIDKGMALIHSMPGIDAVVVDAAGVLHYSSGLLAPSAVPGKP